MAVETIRKAYYVKLGAAAKWAPGSIAEGKLRFGWVEIPLRDLEARDWDAVRASLATRTSNKGTVTSEAGRLEDLVTSTSDDVWITFHDSHLRWGRLSSDPVQEDAISRYRTLSSGWHDRDAAGTPITIDRVPGVIAQLQAFRGTVCSVRDKDALGRLINAESSAAYRSLNAAYRELDHQLAAAIRGLHWKDFEVLVDLVFRQAGWRRRSTLGESMKYVDLELVEPITEDRYQVQIKSSAGVSDFEEYARQFPGGLFRRLYFVVHTPTPALASLKHDFSDVELVLPRRLAKLVADGGLVGWVLDKIR